MKISVYLLLALVLYAPDGNAQDKTPPPAAVKSPAPAAKQSAAPGADSAKPAVDPAKEKDIRRLLDVLGTRALFEQSFTEMNKNMRPMLENTLPAGEYRPKLIDAFFAKFQSKVDVQQLLDIAVPIYDRYLSHEDIKGLINFYQTPLGQKTVKALPQITVEVMGQSQKMGEDLGRQAMLEVLAEHPDFEKAMEEAQKSKQP